MFLVRCLLSALLIACAVPASAGVKLGPAWPRCLDFAAGDAERARLISARRTAFADCDRAVPTSRCASIWGYLVVASQDVGDATTAEAYAPLFVESRGTRPRAAWFADVYLRLAEWMDLQTCFTEGEPLYRKALALLEAEPTRVLDVASTYSLLGLNLNEQNRPAEAEAAMRAALAIRTKLLPAGDPALLQTWQDIAYFLEDQQRFAEAEPIYKMLFDAREGVPSLQGQLDLAVTYTNLAYNLAGQGRLAEGEALFRKGLKMAIPIVGEHDPMIAKGRTYLAAILEQQGKGTEAEAMYRQALAVLARASALDPDRARVIIALARYLQAQGRSPAEVRTLFRIAGADARLRLQSFTGFSAGAQAELLRNAPLYIGQVRAAWDLSRASPTR
ncbi:tetratricopeptide repeat protein [Sphingomonas sp. LT1P40]|uniref:tetratricopeptide repeat protein n=1 Tax=Alteristakelama amylovorans TaxID=3096166 RepID=UPI002FC7F709